jgi:ATP-dependent RNA helicase DDX19/DBP5
MLLFSATYKNPVIEFATKIVKEPMMIRLRRQEESLSYIKQFFVMCDNFESKYTALTNIYGLITVGQSIIFCHVIIQFNQFNFKFLFWNNFFKDKKNCA